MKLILFLLFTFTFTQEKDSLFFKDRVNFTFSTYFLTSYGVSYSDENTSTWVDLPISSNSTQNV